jgi:hypothetical protein
MNIFYIKTKNFRYGSYTENIPDHSIHKNPKVQIFRERVNSSRDELTSSGKTGLS